MTASNHVLTGSLIAYSVQNPAVGLPLAFLSHFVLDALPHFGNHPTVTHESKKFRNFLIVDGFIVAVFIAWMIATQPDRWMYILAGGAAGYMPDLMWVPYYLRLLKGEFKEPGIFSRLHKKIQWAERPWGIYIEAAWLGVFSGLTFIFFR